MKHAPLRGLRCLPRDSTGSSAGGSAANLAANDNQYFSVQSPPNRITTWYGRFTGVPQSATGLSVTYSGGNTVSCSQTVSIYRWSDAVWVQLDARGVGTETLLNLTPPGAASQYVSSTGELRVQVYCRAPAGVKSYVTQGDLMSITYVG